MNNELMHHGILGMKWGIRRYQNKDGSLTLAGKRRLKNGETNTETKDSAKKITHKKSISEMSDAELREKIQRLELEKRYTDLTKNTEIKKVSKGKAFVMDVLEKSGKNIATQATAYAMGSIINKAFRKIAGDNIVDPKLIQKKK